MSDKKKVIVFNDNAVLGELDNILNEEKKVDTEEVKEEENK